MSKLKVLVSIKSFEDTVSSNNPLMNGIDWTRPVNTTGSNPLSQVFSVAPGASQTLFSGTRTLSQDNTTVYSTSLIPGTSTYQLSYISGTAPSFRTLRTLGTNSSSQVTVTTNGPLTTFSCPDFNLIAGGAIVGDIVQIGAGFSVSNQGQFPILALTATSLTVNNSVGFEEGPIVLGSNFATVFRVFSSSGVQVGDVLVINGGFSQVTWGTYIITSVTDYYVQFSSSSVLPQESSVQTDALNVYSSAKLMVYLESNQPLQVLINGSNSATIQPTVMCGTNIPGMFLLNSTIYSLQVQNNGLNTANVFLASIE